MSDVAQLTINTLRTLAIDAVQKANSGHPGAPMGLAPAAYTIFKRHMRHCPSNPVWPNRDRFVLSNGHASMLLYGMLHITGYDLTMQDIKRFRQWDSNTPGHPELGITPGVEVTTGPLGQGLSTAVGMALAEAQLRTTYDGLIDHYTYGICSDGDLMEGVTAEACSLAGHLGLGRLIFLYDDNQITIDGRTDIAFTEDVLKRYEAYGWHVDRVEDGNDVDAIDAAIIRAKGVTDKPSLISVRTIIGFGSPNKADTSSSHGSPLGAEEIAATKAAYGWTYDAFEVPEVVHEHMNVRNAGEELELAWKQRVGAYGVSHPDEHADFLRRIEGQTPICWTDDLPVFEADPKGMATRASSGKVIAKVYELLPELTGGSADLAGSTKTLHPEFGVIQAGNYGGQNIHWGIREHAMAAIANGMCAHGGVRGFGSTFLVFADYMRPALRMAALSHLPSLMVFTHDSIGLGEDGPTHQPVEQLASLRAMPNYWVMRPADANEVTECWIAAVERLDGPTGLVLTRQAVPTLDRAALQGMDGDATRGGYIVTQNTDAPELVLIGTGSELSIALEAYHELAADGMKLRLVSLPCWSLFETQGKQWIDHVLPKGTKRLSIEAGSSFGWERWVGRDGVIIGLDRFGASAPAEILYQKFGFTAANVVQKARGLMR